VPDVPPADGVERPPAHPAGFLDTVTDAELLAAHRAGDPAAFGALAGRHRRELWGIALRTLGNPHDAADAVQEALVAAYRRSATFRGEASVRTWLRRILVNACVDRVRHERVRATVPWPARDVPARRGDPAVETVTRLAVDAALAMLPVEQRVAVVLVDVQGYPVAEVAAILGVPNGTVKSRCARGRARLAALLGHLREEER
jgi:RNA polymerase sigma-70 factor, ECF subfamily